MSFSNKKILISCYFFFIVFASSFVNAKIVYTMDKPYNEYTWVTAHNSHASTDNIVVFAANQSVNMYEQLKYHQVRGLMIDIGYGLYGTFRNKLRLVHGVNAGEFVDRMQNEVVRYLNEDRSAVLFIEIETRDNITPGILKTGMDSLPGITGRMFNPKDPRWKNHTEWPTLKELVDADQRIIMVVDKIELAGNYGDYTIMWRKNVTAENMWAQTSVSSCEQRHGYGVPTINITGHHNWTRLLTMNHFGTAGNWIKAGSDNNWDGLYARIDTCKTAAQLNTYPNFLAVDYLIQGDVQEIVKVLTEGGIIFYNKNNGEGSIVCGLGARQSQVVLRGQKGCENDEARSASLVNVPAGTVLTLYDDPNGGPRDDYVRVAAVSDIGNGHYGYLLNHFQMNRYTNSLNMTYTGSQAGDPNSSKLNGKVSSWDIEAAVEVAAGIVHQPWSKHLKESADEHFVCPVGQLLVARKHIGNASGYTRYKCATYEINGENVLSGYRTWSHKIKESYHHADYSCGNTSVMVGRDHNGNENGSTYYLCETLKYGFYNDSGSRSWIDVGRESSSSITCGGKSAMVARAHHGDENGHTYYKCADILNH